MGYDLVTIADSTKFMASGTVSYASVFCRDDPYTVTPFTTWKAKKRGICLVTKVTATVTTPEGEFVAKPYESSGTSYAHFAIVQVGPNSFVVTRIVSAHEDEIPEDYVEPTEDQK